MESSTPLLYIIFSVFIFFVIIFFSVRSYLKKKSLITSTSNSSASKTDHFKRKEIQSIDSGAVIIPGGSKKYSVHWEKYKNANALLDGERTDEAIVIYKSLAAIPEEAETALIGLGTCYSLKGEQTEAIACYQKAIQLNEKNFNAFLGLASANYRQAHYPTAIVYYKKANALNPEIPDSYWGLAAAYHMLKENELASENAKIFIGMVPDSKYRKYLEVMIIA